MMGRNQRNQREHGSASGLELFDWIGDPALIFFLPVPPGAQWLQLVLAETAALPWLEGP